MVKKKIIKKVAISPRRLLDVLSHSIKQSLLKSESTDISNSFVYSDQGLSISFGKIWTLLGRTIKRREKNIFYEYKLPDAGRLYTENWQSLNSLAKIQTKWLIDLIPEDIEEVGTLDEASALIHVILEQLPEVQINKNENELVSILTTIVIGIRITEAELLRRQNPILNVDPSFLVSENGVVNLKADLKVFSDALNSYFGYLQALRWDKNFSIPQIFSEFLPIGYWPNLPINNSNFQKEKILLSESEVEEKDPRVNIVKLDFYKSLGCRKLVEPIIGTDFHRRKYIAYIFIAKSGDRIAVLDTQVEKNAAYVFRIGKRGEEHKTEWIQEAQKTKYDLVNRTGPINHFLGRIIHSKGWQTRFRNVLNML